MASYVYEAMHPYQRTGAHFLRRAGSGLIADQPGLGKTIQALGAIIATAAEENTRWAADPVLAKALPTAARWHLVVAPKVAVRNVWEPEIHRWLRDKAVEVLTLTGTLAERQSALEHFEPRAETEHVFVIGNIEAMRIKPVPDTYSKQLRPTAQEILRYSSKGGNKTKMAYHPDNALLPAVFARVWDTVICDESHRALIRTNGVPSQTRAGFLLIKSRHRIALSGTPMRGKPEQLWGTLNWLFPRDFTSYWAWVKKYFAITADRYSQYIVGGLTESGQHRLARDLGAVMLRRTKAEVLPELPPKTYAGAHVIEGDDGSPLGVWLEMTPKQRKQYDRLMLDGLVGNTMVDNALAEYTRARQIAAGYCDVIPVDEEHVNLRVEVGESPKFDWLVEWLEENEGEKVVVNSQYTDTVINAFAEGLRDKGFNVAVLTGQTSEKKRTKAIEDFQNGDAQVFLLNTKAGGVALTLDAADYLVSLDETSIPDDQEQVEDRIHRASRMHNVTIYVLRMLDTIEEEVAYIAAARQDVQRYLLDGARGVEYAKKVYLTSVRDAAKKESVNA